MSREVHVRFWESAGVRFPRATRPEISTTERYAHLADDPIRKANERIGDHIWAVISGQPKAEVVAIGERSGAQTHANSPSGKPLP